MKTIFLRALEADDKAEVLRIAIREPAASLGKTRFDVDIRKFCWHSTFSFRVLGQ